MNDPEIVLVAHNIRSCHNVGAIMRTAEGLGVNKLYLTGHTPYPAVKNDRRLPHLNQRQTRQIHKTALGAENTLDWQYCGKIKPLIKKLRAEDYELLALEQTPRATALNEFQPSQKVALLIGSEVGGLPQNLLQACKIHLQIPMQGRKESFGVAAATAIGLYHLRYGGFESRDCWTATA